MVIIGMLSFLVFCMVMFLWLMLIMNSVLGRWFMFLMLFSEFFSFLCLWCRVSILCLISLLNELLVLVVFSFFRWVIDCFMVWKLVSMLLS